MLKKPLVTLIGSCLLAAAFQISAQDQYRIMDGGNAIDVQTHAAPMVFAEGEILHAESMGTDATSSLKVRVISAGGDVVYDAVTDQSSLTILIGDLGLPNGMYRYEVRVEYLATEVVSLSGELGNISRHHFGVFKIHNGMIGDPVDNPSVPGEDQANEAQVSWPVRMAGRLLDLLVADAAAANDGVNAHDNTCVGGPVCDTTSMPTNTTNFALNDFSVVDDSSSNADFEMINSEGSVLFNVNDNIFTIFDDDNGDVLMRADTAGDISFANSAFFIDKTGAVIQGATSLFNGLVDFEVHDTAPQIGLFHIASGDYFALELNGVDQVGFFGHNSGGSIHRVMGFDIKAPDSLYIDSVGNIGMGTSSPAEAVDVSKSGAASRFQLTSSTSTANEAAQFVQRRARAGNTAVLAGDNLGLFSFRGHNGTGYSATKAGITVKATEDWSTGENGTRMLFQTTKNDTTTLNTVMEITQDSKVLINGVALNVPDYVFEDDYELMSLDDLAAYIKEHKHLPGVASADEVNTNGLDLGGSQMSYLEKIEELTLYTLQQHQELASLREENAELRADYLALRAEMQKVERLEQLVALLMEKQTGEVVLTSND